MYIFLRNELILSCWTERGHYTGLLLYFTQTITNLKWHCQFYAPSGQVRPRTVVKCIRQRFILLLVNSHLHLVLHLWLMLWRCIWQVFVQRNHHLLTWNTWNLDLPIRDRIMTHRNVQYQCFVHAISNAATFSLLWMHYEYENEALLALLWCMSTLHENRTGTSTGDGTATIGNNGSWSCFCLWLVWTFLHGTILSIWFLHLSHSGLYQCEQAISLDDT